MVYKSDAQLWLDTLFKSKEQSQRIVAYKRLGELINTLLPDKEAEAE